MERSVRDRKPFFLYYPMTQIQFPTLTHPDFVGKTGAGDIADAMAEVDDNVARMLDAIDRLGISRSTIVFWCADNGAEKVFEGKVVWGEDLMRLTLADARVSTIESRQG